MSFNPSNLSVLAYANGFTLWHYRTIDTASSVDNQGYFDEASDVFRSGDMILANTGTGGSSAAGLFLVSSAAAGMVDVADLLAIGTTNAD